LAYRFATWGRWPPEARCFPGDPPDGGKSSSIGLSLRYLRPLAAWSAVLSRRPAWRRPKLF